MDKPRYHYLQFRHRITAKDRLRNEWDRDGQSIQSSDLRGSFWQLGQSRIVMDHGFQCLCTLCQTPPHNQLFLSALCTPVDVAWRSYFMLFLSKRIATPSPSLFLSQVFHGFMESETNWRPSCFNAKSVYVDVQTFLSRPRCVTTCSYSEPLCTS